MCCNVSVPGTFTSLLCVLDRKLNVDCGPGLRMLCRCVALRSPVVTLSYPPAEPQEHCQYLVFSIRLECPCAMCEIERPQTEVHQTLPTLFALSGWPDITWHRKLVNCDCLLINRSRGGSDEVKCVRNLRARARTQCTSVFYRHLSIAGSDNQRLKHKFSHCLDKSLAHWACRDYFTVPMNIQL